jgi:tricorn protease
MKPVCPLALSALVLSVSGFLVGAAADTRVAPLMRYPTSSPTQLAFVARGDLWIAPREGGRAHRVVQSEGHISAPRFSPDGRFIAYTDRRTGRLCGSSERREAP